MYTAYVTHQAHHMGLLLGLRFFGNVIAWKFLVSWMVGTVRVSQYVSNRGAMADCFL